jgi:hypothetical protein
MKSFSLLLTLTVVFATVLAKSDRRAGFFGDAASIVAGKIQRGEARVSAAKAIGKSAFNAGAANLAQGVLTHLQPAPAAERRAGLAGDAATKLADKIKKAENA